MNMMSGNTISHHELCFPVRVLKDDVVFQEGIVNPRRASMFPWLHTLAMAYEMFNFDQLEFRYVPSCASTFRGQIVMCLDYDVTDDNTALTFDALSASQGSVVGQLYAPLTLAYRPANTVLPAHKYFCSAGTAPDRFNDPARFIFMTRSPEENGVCGHIEVWYKVRLSTPEPNLPTFGQMGTARRDAAHNATQDGTAARPLGPTLATIKTMANAATATAEAVNNVAKNINQCTATAADRTVTLYTVPNMWNEFTLKQASFKTTIGMETPGDTLPFVDAAFEAETPYKHLWYYGVDQVFVEFATYWSWTPNADDTPPTLRVSVASSYYCTDCVTTHSSIDGSYAANESNEGWTIFVGHFKKRTDSNTTIGWISFEFLEDDGVIDFCSVGEVNIMDVPSLDAVQPVY